MSGLSTYPGTKDTFSDKRFKQDVNASNDMNKVQDVCKAIEDTLGVNPQGSQADVKTLLQRCLATTGAMRNGSSFPGSPNVWDFFYRSDVKKMYVWDGTTWNAVSVIEDYAAGDILLASSDSSLNLSDVGTYTKRKSIKIPRLGTLRIKFSLTGGSGGAQGKARVYKNGVAVGTERTSTASTTTEFSEDIANWNAQDEVQIYGQRDESGGAGGADATLTNFRIYATTVTVESVVYNA